MNKDEKPIHPHPKSCEISGSGLLGTRLKMFTKLRGVTFNNRQENIIQLKESQELKITKSPNQYHSQALLVTTLDNNELGFIKKEIADNIYIRLKEDNYICKVLNITGINIKGVNIYLKVVT